MEKPTSKPQQSVKEIRAQLNGMTVLDKDRGGVTNKIASKTLVKQDVVDDGDIHNAIDDVLFISAFLERSGEYATSIAETDDDRVTAIYYSAARVLDRAHKVLVQAMEAGELNGVKTQGEVAQ